MSHSLRRADPPAPDPVADESADAPLLAWEANADAWTRAYREGRIPGRAVADEAMVKMVRDTPPGPVLDAGCGEGWLVRALAERKVRAFGIDASEAMIARAKEAGGDFRALPYELATRTRRWLGGPYGTVVFNFSLPAEKITQALEMAASVLFPYGRILIQAWHPALAEGGEYREGWREETFDGCVRPAPYYFRTVGAWIAELRRARLHLIEVREPVDPATGRPVTLLLNATIPERWR